MNTLFARLALSLTLAIIGAAPVAAATFTLPTDGSTVVGQVLVVEPSAGNTLPDIARHYDVGYEEITRANPNMSVWTPRGPVVVPRQFILPPQPWQGIVLNIPQRRLYYFPVAGKGQAPKQVITYPISIAREGWSTPLGTTRITAKHKDPAWFVPKSIREEHLREEGVELPDYFPPGPDNPMGMLAMQTGFPGIFIHATNRPWGVGLRASHGCLHLYPEDAAQIFPQLKVGTPVRVIDEAVLVGKDRDRWVMATFETVAEYPDVSPLSLRATQALSTVPLPQDAIDQKRVERLGTTPQPVPVALSPSQPDLAAWLRTLPVERYDFEPYGIDANNAMLPRIPASEDIELPP
ncbi:MAG: L,D-transpeptidase family protein [Pseudogulbenkiania sp.]|nr:L,D-transpeptidase family protein [Pseudogulbenkiania sp.]